VSWDDLSPEHKAIAFDGLAQAFGQANWQRELSRNAEGLMLATLSVFRGPEGLQLEGWLDVLREELHVMATWGERQRRTVALGLSMRHTRGAEQLHEMLRMGAEHLSHDIKRESGHPTVIRCLSFRDAYDVLDKRRRT
jgi:hypothetical protein